MLREPPARRSAFARHPTGSAVAVLTILAAALRLYRIGHQGLWFDEAYTVMLVKLPFAKLLSTVPKTESTPYLYYLLAWVWTHIFGRGASDLRALSALAGTAVVPVGYLATAKLTTNRRAGLIVAALATFNPLLIWYSQEARAYELLVLMSACTLLAFAWVRDEPTSGRFAVWALASGLALATHYDAALVVVPEAVWLLVEHRHRLGAWLSVAFVAACGGGLLPLLIAQNSKHNTTWITKAPLNDRLGQILPQFFLGTGSHAYKPLTWVAFVLGIAGLVLLANRASSTERNRALAIAGIAGGGFALVMIVVWAGSDTVLTRNLLGLWLPAAIVLACGLGAARAGRLGIAIAAVICAVGVTATVSVATDATLQRPDWPAVVRALGPWPRAGQPAGATRLLVFQRNVWLESLTHVYMTHTRWLAHDKPHDVSEIDVIANSSPPGSNKHWLCWWGAGCNLYPSRLQASYAIPGFHAVSTTRVNQFTILRLASDRPRRVHQGQIKSAMRRARSPHYGLLIQRP
jgi:mannosyltransferase